MTSIIILNYKRPGLTIQCLESIIRSTNAKYRIILVNNSPQDLDEIMASDAFLDKNTEIHTITNRTNVGFAKGNNQGIRLAKSLGTNYYVLLNNDTFVTDGWITKMRRVIDRNKEVGAVGPMTNPPDWTNNPEIKRQFVEYRDQFYRHFFPSLEKYARQFDCKKGLKPVRFLAFFCVMIPERVLTDVGLLNEIFSYGTWEDTDYCERLLEKDYVLALANNVYIHHIRNQAIVFPEINFDCLYKRNRAIFDRLWPNRDYDDGDTPNSKKNCSKLELFFWDLVARWEIWRRRGKTDVF